MHVTLVLADAATIAENRLNLLGAGWNVATSNTPVALAVLVRWQLNDIAGPYQLRLTLVDSDGRAVWLPGAAAPFEARSELVAPHGVVDTTTTLVFGFMPALPLPAGVYQFTCEVDGQVVDTLSFRMVAPGQLPAPGPRS